MRRILLAAAIGCWLPMTAQAQLGSIGSYSPPQTNPRPVYSPYLNLTRPGGSVGANYYGLVRPQVDAQRNIMLLQQQAQMMGIAPEAFADPFGVLGHPDPASSLTTGHSAVYLNTGHYYRYPGQAGSGAGGSVGRAGGATGQPVSRSNASRSSVSPVGIGTPSVGNP